MKVYTKTGDRGSTALIGGKRVPKSDNRIEAYGTVDELIAYIGLIRDQLSEKDQQSRMVEIQDRLMTCASILATDCDDCQDKLPKLHDSDTELLEKWIDEMETKLPPLRSFVLPGGHTTVSFVHIARNVCRRAERCVLRIDPELIVDGKVVKYLNRLSDFLFVFARKLSFELHVEEVAWKPRL